MKKMILILLLIVSSKLSATISNNAYEIDLKTYEECILHIKSHESFKSKVYTSLDKEYIGYGHLIKKYEQFEDGISEYHATLLLKKDFDLCINYMHRQTKLKSNKLLAISLLSYNLGVGKVVKYIETDKILKDYSKTLKYCNYKVGGVVKHSDKLYKRRLFEYNLWIK